VKLAKIPPFAPADWAAEDHAFQTGRSLACPNCERVENYALYSAQREDGSERRYRGCKSCGCWQEADGTLAYRCSLLIHSCAQPIPEGTTCRNCDTWGPRSEHRCHRVLPPNEIGVTRCRQCAVVQTHAHVVGWPVRAE